MFSLSPPFSAEVKNVWSYTSTPQYVFMEQFLVKNPDNFTSFITCIVPPTCLGVVMALLPHVQEVPGSTHGSEADYCNLLSSREKFEVIT
jgi:hypothetical protein